MIYNNVTELIGNTPLVKYDDNICVKLEYFNPSNSIKDRAAYSMLKYAQERGEINNDTVIIEPTSGNTGIGLAMCCAVMGLKIIICMPESMSEERKKSISAYGAELVLTPKEKGMQGSVDKAIELSKKYPNSFIPMQFSNMDNPKAHKQTAKEIFDATEGKVDIVVAGIGTGGTAIGLKKYFKELRFCQSHVVACDRHRELKFLELNHLKALYLRKGKLVRIKFKVLEQILFRKYVKKIFWMVF